MDKNTRAYLAELIGTFVFVFVAAGVVCVNGLAAIAWHPRPVPPDFVLVQPEPGLVGIATATGLAYAAVLAATLYHGGGYLNPAIVLALWVFKRLDTVRAFGLIAVQLLGAVLAGGMLRLVFSFREDIMSGVSLGTPHVNNDMFDPGTLAQHPAVPLLTGIGVGFVLTMLMAFVIFATLVDPRAVRWLGKNRLWGCVVAGAALAASILVSFPLTGPNVNPARWFGTVVWETTIPSLQLLRPFRDQVVYWFGPIAGALFAGLVYMTWILPEQEPAAAPVAAPPIKTSTASSPSRPKR
jgi:glycerol uptake facilitator-like aquaporin